MSEYPRILVAVEKGSCVSKPDYVDLIEVEPGAPPARYVQTIYPGDGTPVPLPLPPHFAVGADEPDA